MEHGIEIDSNVLRDFGYIRNVGYKENNLCIQQYYSQDTVNIISNKITEILQGVDHLNRPIIVPDHLIINVMNSVYNTYRPETGDIYSRYNIPSLSQSSSESHVQNMIDQTIQIITSDVRNNLEMQQCNSKLTIWTTVLGDFNENGLRSHPKIKVRTKRPNPLQFNMNY